MDLNRIRILVLNYFPWMLLSCLISPAVLGQQTNTVDGKKLSELMAPIEEWHSVRDRPAKGLSYTNWDRLISVARWIQQVDPRSVERALFDYQMEGSESGEFQRATSNEFMNDRKLVLLMRVIFEVPESLPDDGWRVEFGGWVTMGTDRNTNGTVNRAWPIRWNDGTPRLVSGFRGIQGINSRYDAAGEFNYLRTHYKMRDLSVVGKK